MSSQAVCKWLRSLGYESKPAKVTLPKKVLVKNGKEKREGTVTLEGTWYLDKVIEGDERFYVLGEIDEKALVKMNCFKSDPMGSFYIASYSNKATFEDTYYRKVTEEWKEQYHPFGHSIVFRLGSEESFEQDRKWDQLKGEYQMTVEFIEEE